MSEKLKKSIRTKSILIGTVMFLISIIAGLCIYGYLLLSDNNSGDAIGSFCYVMIGISAVIGGLLSGIININNGIQVGSVTAFLDIVLIFIISFVINEPAGFTVGEILLKVFVILFFNIIGAIIGVNIKKKY